MESLIRSVYGRADAEYVIKKSRFIATVCEVKSEDEASAFIDEVKKKYWDAPATTARPTRSAPTAVSSGPAMTANRLARQDALSWKSSRSRA